MKAFRPKPLPATMLVTAIIGALISTMYLISGRQMLGLNRTWWFTFLVFFVILFIAVFVSIEPTPEERK